MSRKQIVAIALVAGLAITGWIVYSNWKKPTAIVDPTLASSQLPEWVSKATYAGSESCRDCHAETVEKYQSHPMAHAIAPAFAPELKRIEVSNASFKSNPYTEYKVEWNDRELIHKEIGVAADGSAIYEQSELIKYVLGAGAHGRSYVLQKGKRLFLSPASWYSKNATWDLSPGYNPQNHLRFGREAGARCLICHSGQVNLDPASPKVSHDFGNFQEPAFVEFGISCERCHGPASEHIAYHRNGKAGYKFDPICNPSSLDPVRRDAACNQCHLQGLAEILRPGKTHEDFRPGMKVGDVWSVFLKGGPKDDKANRKAVTHVQQMTSSKCYIASNKAMGCTSCHDPHSAPTEQVKLQFYRKSCIACHEQTPCSLPEDGAERKAVQDSCVACHMSQFDASDVPHTIQTDHRILRRPEPSIAEEELARQLDFWLEWELFDEGDETLTGTEKERAWGIAIARGAEAEASPRGANEAIEKLTPLLPTYPDDSELLDALAISHSIKGEPGIAAQYWSQILKKQPHHENALFSLGILSHDNGELGKARDYFLKLLETHDYNADVHGRLSNCFARLGDVDNALKHALRSLELNPSRFSAYNWTADLYDDLEKPEEAKKLRETAEKLRIAQENRTTPTGPNLELNLPKQ